MTPNCLHLLMLCAVFSMAACKKQKDDCPSSSKHDPKISAANFTASTSLTNPYARYARGKKYIYEGETEEGTERIVVERRPATKWVNGILCIIVRDRVYHEGILVEDTDDWYAQDNAGNVWYMGEYVTDYNSDGSVKDHDGSWEAGVDCAKPGYHMLANPRPGNAYYQEYAVGEAEDEAVVVATGLSITVPFGTFTNCIKIKETTQLEPTALEYKFYAPGIGLIKSVNAVDETEVVLTAIE